MIKTKFSIVMLAVLSMCACSNDDSTDTDDGDDTGTTTTGTIHSAFGEFDENNVTVYLDGSETVIETNGQPNHESPYWSPNHDLHVDPTTTTTKDMAPGYIDDFTGSYTLRVPTSPELASSTSATGLGAIGLAVSGAVKLLFITIKKVQTLTWMQKRLLL